MRCLITGASSGIGETIARRLAAEGHPVALMARRTERVREIAAELGSAIAVPGDVGSGEDCEAVVQRVVEAFGGVDTLVNAAGTWVEDPLHAATYEQIRRFVDTDVSGALQITRAALPQLMKGGGRLVHINGLQGLIRVRPPPARRRSGRRSPHSRPSWPRPSRGSTACVISLTAAMRRSPRVACPCRRFSRNSRRRA